MKTLRALQNKPGLMARFIDATWWRVLLLWVLTMLLRHFIGSLAVTSVLAYPGFLFARETDSAGPLTGCGRQD